MKKWWMILFAFCIMGWFSFNTMAAELPQTDISYDKAAGVLHIAGQSGKLNGKLVTASGYRQMTGENPAAQEAPAFADATNTKENGFFEIHLSLSKQLPSGRYMVRVVSAEGIWEDTISYVNSEQTVEILPLLKAAADNDALYRLLVEYANSLCIDVDTLAEYQKQILPILRVFLSQSAIDGETFVLYYDSAVVRAKLENGDDMELVLEQYLPTLGLEYAQEFAECPQEVLQMLKELIVADTEQSLHQTILQKRALAFAKSAKTWSSLKYYMEERRENGGQYAGNAAILLDTLENYSKAVRAGLEDDIFIAVFRQMNDINSFEQLKNQMASEIKAVLQRPLQQGGKPSGGGSGSGGIYNVISQAPLTQGNIADSEPNVTHTFYDMNGHWAEDKVNWLVKLQVISGFPDDSFAPEQPVTRAQFAAMLVKAFSITADGEASFRDVDDSAWYAEAVKAAASHGILLGTDAGDFLPDDSISRQDMAVMLYRCFADTADIAPQAELFTDAEEIAAYAKPAVDYLVRAALIQGMGDGSFMPTGQATRAQAAVIIANALEYEPNQSVGEDTR